MIQIPNKTNLPTVPKVLECPLMILTPIENKNKNGISRNRKMDSTHIILGAIPISKK